ncbi:MAG: Rne/Rng family ribonuclease [Planctomycetaceae bacterium]|nr:Rne/Rng family ribonuclease [Planctomycetaceae bacterium]MCL2304393.1 Rne/Rng family ribonuclease [Planctomycetaceae bacterium]
MKQEMLINVRQQEECRIAVVENGVLEELYVERTNQDNYVGNIYKGVVTNLEPSIQAAFVDFGVGRNGFLHISDVEAHYFDQVPGWAEKAAEKEKARAQKEREEYGGRPPRFNPDFDGFGYNRPRFKPPIQEVFQRGDEVIVQVIKEGLGNKGPTLSTYISIPGRYLVLMPSLGRVGVSRKIPDESVRRKLRDLMHELHPPKDLGFIVRTAGADRTRKELSRDLAYLIRLWKVIVRRLKKMPAPIDLYEESDMIIRTIRDIFTSEVGSITIDEPAAFERAKEFLQQVMPRYADRLHLYSGKEPIFHKYNLDQEIAKIHHRRVTLKDGGSIVIDQTEALVAIDVNSGNFRSEDNAEDTAYQMNLRAAKEIARQIRLRDLGGVIVNDFIDMKKESHRRHVERVLRDAVKRDRARTKILRTSPFGLIEMTRQRIRPSLKRSIYQECPCCKGGGVVKSVESMVLEVFRTLVLASQKRDIAKIRVSVVEEVAEFLNNRKRHELAKVEEDGHTLITIHGKSDVWPEFLELECVDRSGNIVPFSPMKR